MIAAVEFYIYDVRIIIAPLAISYAEHLILISIREGMLAFKSQDLN